MSFASVKSSPRGERRHRRHPRYRTEFPVTLTVFSGDQPEQLSAHCRDLSVAGIGVVIAEELQLGDVMGMFFTLPGRPETWNLRAVLRYRRGYHYGFEFLSLTAQQSAALAGYVPALERLETEWDSPATAPLGKRVT